MERPTNLTVVSESNRTDLNHSVVPKMPPIPMFTLNPATPIKGLGTPPDDITYLALWIIVAVQAILFLAIVIGNGLVIFAVINFSRLQTLTNEIVTSLAVSDFIMGFVAPFSILITIFPKADMFVTTETCILPFGMLQALCLASICNMTLVTIDRYLAICHPFVHANTNTRFYIRGAMICGWVLSIFIGLILPLFWNKGPLPPDGECTLEAVLEEPYLAFIFVVCIPLIVTIFILYGLIYRVARHQARRIMAERESCAAIVGNSTMPPQTLNKFRRKERKVAWTIAIVILAFIFCWMPMIIFSLIELYYRSSGQKYLQYATLIRVSVASLAVANSAINPIIYALRLKEFRSAFRKLLKCHSKCNPLSSEVSDLSGSSTPKRKPPTISGNVQQRIN